jgi:hypothetical protein
MSANVLERPETPAPQLIGSTPLVAIEHEPAPRLVVDPPLPGPLSEGRVYIQYRTENIRILPVFGAGALDVSPRVGHLHVTVDAAPWHFVDASGGTIVLVGLPPGPHKVLIELADPTHRVIAAQTINFNVPAERNEDPLLHP